MQEAPRTITALPVFPLPDYHLFPGVVAPLHVFETRYRQMMEDLMDGPGRLVLAPFRPDGPRSERGPELGRVGTLAEIVQHERLADGRWVMIIAALDRVTMTEVESERLYRKVDATPVADDDPPDGRAEELRARLAAALRARADGDWETPAGTSAGRLADLLLHALAVDDERRDLAYHEADPLARAELALAWHEADEDEFEAEA